MARPPERRARRPADRPPMALAWAGAAAEPAACSKRIGGHAAPLSSSGANSAAVQPAPRRHAAGRAGMREIPRLIATPSSRSKGLRPAAPRAGSALSLPVPSAPMRRWAASNCLTSGSLPHAFSPTAFPASARLDQRSNQNWQSSPLADMRGQGLYRKTPSRPLVLGAQKWPPRALDWTCSIVLHHISAYLPLHLPKIAVWATGT